jgi:chromosome segregation ATPase
MPRWLKKVGKFADKITDSVVERVTEKISSELGSIDDLGPTVSKLKETASQCNDTARETVEICSATEDKHQAMIDFASEIQSTLSGLKDADASVLETIKQLTDGQRIESAIALAQGLDETAIQCVEKSIKMIDTMEDGMDSLPEVVQKAIEHAAGSDDDDGDDGDDGDDDDDDIDMLKDLDRDIADVKTCIDSLKHMNLVTAFKVGLEAFTQLTEKAKSSRSMFESIQEYAKDVEKISKSTQRTWRKLLATFMK